MDFNNREKSVWYADIKVKDIFNETYFYLELNASDNFSCQSQVKCCYEPKYLLELYQEGKLEMVAKDLAMAYLNATIKPNAMRQLNDRIAELSKQH